MTRTQPDTAMLVLAGGSGRRIDDEVNKVYVQVAGRALLSYALEAMLAAARIDPIVLVVRGEDAGPAQGVISTLTQSHRIVVVAGGTTRHQSERAGLEPLGADIQRGRIKLVGIHDGARPFVTVDLIDRLVVAALATGGAVPALPVEEPVYRREGDSAHLVDSSSLRRVQTPQVFSAPQLLEAYQRAEEENFEGVDTAETVERFSDLVVQTVTGDPRNLKVTFAQDFIRAETQAPFWKPAGWVQ